MSFLRHNFRLHRRRLQITIDNVVLVVVVVFIVVIVVVVVVFDEGIVVQIAGCDRRRPSRGSGF